MTGLLLVGAAVGAFGSGRLSDRIGRRPVILLTASVFVVGVLGAAFSPALWVLIAMRFVIGLAVGSASMSVPLYISEVAPPRVRGALVSFNQLALTLGILAAFLVDYALSSSSGVAAHVRVGRNPGCPALRGHAEPGREPGLAGHARTKTATRKVLVRVRSLDHDVDGEIDEIRALGNRDIDLPGAPEA